MDTPRQCCRHGWSSLIWLVRAPSMEDAVWLVRNRLSRMRYVNTLPMGYADRLNVLPPLDTECLSPRAVTTARSKALVTNVVVGCRHDAV